MKNQDYNGWTNYATWRLASEVFDGVQFDYEVDAETLKELAEEIIFEFGNSSSLCEDYARCFLIDVNYHEIANHINEEFTKINYI